MPGIYLHIIPKIIAHTKDSVGLSFDLLPDDSAKTLASAGAPSTQDDGANHAERHDVSDNHSN